MVTALASTTDCSLQAHYGIYETPDVVGVLETGRVATKQRDGGSPRTRGDKAILLR
jgi:hypothetical protein